MVALTETAWPLFKYLRDSQGNLNITGNYSASPTTFYAGPPSNQDWLIQEVFIHYTAAVTQLVAADYASIAGGLTNGIRCYSYAGGVIEIDLTDERPIICNDCFVHLGEVLLIQEFSGNTKSVSGFILRFDGINAGIVLHGAAGDQIRAVANDNFTTLTDHSIMIKGSIA